MNANLASRTLQSPVLGAWGSCALFAIFAASAPDQVLVSAPAPLDADRLADTVRAYLGEFGIRVAVTPAVPAADLRTEIEGTRAVGERARALAVVRVGGAAGDTVEVEMVDLQTDKVLLATLPRPPRDEDLYRALALKIRSVLAATLSEARTTMTPDSPAGRLVARPPEPVLPAPAVSEPVPAAPAALRPTLEPSRVAVEVGYASLSFPGGGLLLQGLALDGGVAPWRWLDLRLGTALYATARDTTGGVDTELRVVPAFLAARVRAQRGAISSYLGPSATLAYVHASPVSTTVGVRPSTAALVALGAEAEGRWAVARGAWIYARLAGAAVLSGQRYQVAGAPVFDTSRPELAGTAGLGIGLR
jgi:hypothetical protein